MLRLVHLQLLLFFLYFMGLDEYFYHFQNLHGKHKEKERHKPQEEVTECEPSRTPEDSVCSNEGPSAVYADLPSTSEHK